MLAFPAFRSALHLPLVEFADPLTAGAPVLFLGAALLALGPLKLLGGRIPHALGEVSYGAYLFHFPILMTLANLVPHASWQEGLLLCIALAILTFAAAWLSFRFFERPMQRLFGFGSATATAQGSAG